MTRSEFWDDMDTVAINEAIVVSGLASQVVYENGEEVPVGEWIFNEDEHVKKSSMRVIKGI